MKQIIWFQNFGIYLCISNFYLGGFIRYQVHGSYLLHMSLLGKLLIVYWSFSSVGAHFKVGGMTNEYGYTKEQALTYLPALTPF